MVKKRDGWRLRYHLMPPDGWLNDPNGLCQFRGEYHVFFQYSPNQPAPDGRIARTWGHYAGKDLLHLEYRGVPFWPEVPDHDGCYSGSALTDGNTAELYYTGNIKEPGEHDFIHDGRQSNTIRVDFDGTHFGRKVVLFGTKDYPAECTRHVRDPKVWKENGRRYMVLGARMQDERGAILFYKSDDGMDWTYLKTLSTEKSFGYMWECPDYFELGDRTFLSLCPQGVASREFCFQNLYQSGYYQVEGELEGEQTLHNFREWDYGFDFYAPQSFSDEQGRRIFIGWSGMPDHPYDNPTDKRGWENALTVPRVLRYEEGKILQTPIEELKDLREEETFTDGHGSVVIPEGSGDIEVDFPDDSDNWGIRFGKCAEFTFMEGILELKMSDEAGYGRKIRHIKAQKIMDLRILLDSSMLEIYANEGEIVFTSRFYPETGETAQDMKVQFSCPGAAVTSWHMKTMETNRDLV